MKKVLVMLALVIVLGKANGQQVVYHSPSVVYVPQLIVQQPQVVHQVPQFSVPQLNAGLAQQKANIQAHSGVMRHVGGSMGAGRFEGVGFSSRSADDAIRHCCYWGQKSPIEIGVARGHAGWYACVIYR